LCQSFVDSVQSAVDKISKNKRKPHKSRGDIFVDEIIMTCPFEFDRVGDDDGACLYTDSQLGNIVGNFMVDMPRRKAAALELLRRIELEEQAENDKYFVQ